MAVFAVANHASANEASAIVVIFNSADPSSEALAWYYANKRKIDGRQLVGLRCPDSEEISRSEYQNDIALPLREIFLAKGWWRAQGGRIVESKVRYVALIRGIPLKIRSREAGAASLPGRQAVAMRDEASLDSELAVLATNDRSDAGVAPNPYYGSFIPILELISGPFAEEGFRFKPGAIAAHIHSFSASTLRDPVAGWCGPLLERGASATLGTVYEPYLMLTTHPDKFQSRLMKGPRK